MGIEVLPPSINESFSQFTVVATDKTLPTGRQAYKIRFGLTTIKNFGQGISGSITAERKDPPAGGGKFKDLADFLDRIKDKNLNKKSLESLIKCGALDDFGERGKLLSNIDTLLGYHKERMGGSKNQESLFDNDAIPQLRLLAGTPATQKDKLAWEKELLGLYISGHPLEAYKEKIASLQTSIAKLPEMHEGDPAVIAGLVEQIRDVLTKGNERMVFMRFADLSGTTEVAVFPSVFNEFKQFVQSDTPIAIKGKVSKRKGETSFIAEKIKAL